MASTHPMQGAYAARSSTKIAPIWLALGILIAFVAGLVVGDSTSPEAAARPSADTAELQAKLRRAELELAQLKADPGEEPEPNDPVADPVDDPFGETSTFSDGDALADENFELKTRVASLEAEVVRYRDALEKSVEELNRLQAEERQPVASAPGPPTGGSPDPDKWVYPRQPYAMISTGRVEIEGSVHNANSEPVSGYVYVTVYEGSREVGSERVALDLRGREVREYSTTITNGMIRQGVSYDVRAEWEPR